jgi:hypothetical protein
LTSFVRPVGLDLSSDFGRSAGRPIGLEFSSESTSAVRPVGRSDKIFCSELTSAVRPVGVRKFRKYY